MASGIGSLASATNSNIGSSVTINAVGRLFFDIASIFVKSDDDIKNGLVDGKRHEICLTTNNKNINAYVPVITTDLIHDKTISIEPDKDFYKLPSTNPVLQNSILDMTIATYYQDIGDARNDFELMLARTQISLHSHKSEVNLALLHSQDRLFWSRSDPTFTSKHRRNALFLLDQADIDEHHDAHKGNWQPYEVVPNNDGDNTFMGVFYKFQHTIQLPLAENNCNFWGINIDGLSEDNLKMALEVVAHYIDSTDNIRVFTPKSSNCSPIKPPQFRYAGIALTDACMHPQNGDTAITVNIFSALTIDNGPFDIVTNDELMWMHEIELPDFMADGLRRRRVVLDSRSLYAIVENVANNPKHRSVHMAFQRITMLAAQEPVIRQQNNVPGNPSRKTFLIAPCKRGFTLLERTSVVDHERRMGRAIAGAKPGKRLDLINGACAHF
jgi:hypothetical protein